MKALFNNYFKDFDKANEGGFSLIELVVAVGVLLVLTVGGLIGYGAVVHNAKVAAVENAADEVLTAVMVHEANGADTAVNNPAKAWNDADPDDSITVDFSASQSSSVVNGKVVLGARCIVVTATHDDGVVGVRSNCPAD